MRIFTCHKFFIVPGELNITYALLGPENRTLVNQVVVENRTNGELEFIRQGFEIITFTNNTFYDLNFTQVNDMDIYDDYFIAAEVSFVSLPVCFGPVDALKLPAGKLSQGRI